MSAFRVTAPATFAGLSERFEAPDFKREVLAAVKIGDGEHAQRLVVPVIGETRTLATVAKHMPTEFRITVEAVS